MDLRTGKKRDLQWRDLFKAQVARGKRQSHTASKFGKEIGRSQSLLKSALACREAPTGAVREAQIIRAILVDPSLLDEQPEEIAALSFDFEGCRELRNAILNAYDGEIGLDRTQLHERLLKTGMGSQLAAILTLARKNGDNFAATGDKEQDRASWFHLLEMHIKTNIEQRQLLEAEQDYCNQTTDENFARIYAISQQREFALR